MLDSNIARDLDLHGKRETLSLQWLNEHCVSHNTEKIDFTISGIGRDDKRYAITNVFTMSNLSLPIQSCHLRNLQRELSLSRESPQPEEPATSASAYSGRLII